MDFVALKKHSVTAGCLFVAFVFGVGAVYLLSTPVREPAYWFRVGALAALTVLALGFAGYWMLFPHKHAVHRALAVLGDVGLFADRLNGEIAREHEVQGPFHFTASFLVYSPGHALDVVPYESIASASKEVDSSGEDSPIPLIVLHTTEGRTYTWRRTWIQGIFDADQVLFAIRNRANLTRKIGNAYYKPPAQDPREIKPPL